MKCSFLLQRQFAYIGHYLAQTLKERHGFTDFSGYVYMRSSLEFLQSQKEIRYSTLLLDQEIHNRWREEKLDPKYLEDLERRIGIPNLWPYLIADRVIMQEQLVREYPHDRLRYTHEELMRMLQVRAKAIDAMLEREKPDVVFGIPPAGLGSMLFFHLARAHGARTLYVIPSNLPKRYLLSEAYDTFAPVDALFKKQPEELLASEDGAWARDFLREYRDRPVPNFEKTTPTHQPVTRAQQFQFLLKPGRAFTALKEIAGAMGRHLATSERPDYDYIHPFWQNVDLVKRKLRNLRGSDDLYDAFDPSIPYAFFPLHLEPELALLVLAPHFTDQIQVIRQVAQSLPANMTLYVKEHPVMAQYRPRSYYKQLKKIPNVKLLSPALTSFQVTTRAKMIFTITGTVGWEACLFGNIPVVSFGNQNFNVLANVTHCTDLDRLGSVIRDRLAHPHTDDKDVLAYLAALHRCSFEMDLKQIWEEERDQEKRRMGVAPLAEAFAKAVK